MSTNSQEAELLASLRTSARNALATFGPTSAQYLSIAYDVDQLAAKVALAGLSLGNSGEEGRGMQMEVDREERRER